MDTRRLESFSDGVFAVAITVLVFNLLEIGRDQRLLTVDSVLGQAAWQKYAAYAVGFLTIGIMWLNHHTLLRHAVRADRVTLILNICLLLGIVALPYPTNLVADHLTDPGQSGKIAVVSYGVVSVLLSVGFSALWIYLTTHQESLTAQPPGTRLRLVLSFTIGLAAYLAGTFIAAFWSPIAGLIIFAAVAVYYLFEHLPEPAPAGRPG